MKAAIDGGEIGAPLMFHSSHRNPSVPGHFTSDMIINDTCVHAVDISRFLLGSEVAAVRVLTARRNLLAGEGVTDPVLVVLEMTSGALVDVEASVNIRFGYDIRGEVVGETGTIELAESNTVVVKKGGQYGGRVPEDWRERFIRAYDTEFQEWIVAASKGESTGPSSWDGYAATVVGEAGLIALRTGERVEVAMREQPQMYRT
jgi:myo-inositol 2-dehydrogenase/D-chiro-inositol 1-dehydrogenase